MIWLKDVRVRDELGWISWSLLPARDSAAWCGSFWKGRQPSKQSTSAGETLFLSRPEKLDFQFLIPISKTLESGRRTSQQGGTVIIFL